jgi:hypothetical protein
MSFGDDTSPDEKKAAFVGEEGGDTQATPESELFAACVLFVISVIAIYFAIGWEVPGSVLTAPGLFPIITGIGLLLMALGLGVMAVRRGARFQFDGPRRWVAAMGADDEIRRGGLLIVIIAVYVLAVDWFGFDLRMPTDFFVFRFSSYELFSIVALGAILRLFWRAPLRYCILVATIWSIALASVFRYGFHILLPGSG